MIPDARGPGSDRDVAADEPDLDRTDAVAQCLADLALQPPLHGGVGGRVAPRLHDDRALPAHVGEAQPTAKEPRRGTRLGGNWWSRSGDRRSGLSVGGD